MQSLSCGIPSLSQNFRSLSTEVRLSGFPPGLRNLLTDQCYGPITDKTRIVYFNKYVCNCNEIRDSGFSCVVVNRHYTTEGRLS